ncbi:MAG TPA: serine protease [Thiobacillus sp.]
MNKKSLLPSGLYRICMALPERIGRMTWLAISKRRACERSQVVARQAGGTCKPRSASFSPLPKTHWLHLPNPLTNRRIGVILSGLLFNMTAWADVADTLLSIKPGVVGVGTYHPTGSPRANLQGTGFAILDGRYVVSCAHIFSKPLDSEKKEIHAVFLGRDRQIGVRPARLVATDLLHDLALLKIEGDPLPALKLGNSDLAREGSQLYFTGYPIGSVLGLNPSTHRAGLAAIVPIYTPLQKAAQLDARTLKQARNAFDIFELDAIAYPGNSGSPVWHPETGEVLGVVNSVYVKGSKEAALSTPSGISYAIPSKYVQDMLDQVLPKIQ